MSSSVCSPTDTDTTSEAVSEPENAQDLTKAPPALSDSTTAAYFFVHNVLRNSVSYPERLVDLCRHHARLVGEELPANRIFWDVGNPADSLSRVELDRLCDLVAAGFVRKIVICSVGDLGADPGQLNWWFDFLLRHRVELMVVAVAAARVKRDGHDIDDESEEVWDRGSIPLDVIASSTAPAGDTRDRKGIKRDNAPSVEDDGVPAPPYGYVRNPDGPGLLVRDPVEAWAIRRLFALHEAFFAMATIVALLNHHGQSPATSWLEAATLARVSEDRGDCRPAGSTAASSSNSVRNSEAAAKQATPPWSGVVTYVRRSERNPDPATIRSQEVYSRILAKFEAVRGRISDT